MLCPLLAAAAFAHEETVEPLASVYAVDPANPQISFDEDPYLYSPPVPEQPTVVYPNGGAPTPDTTDPLLATQPRATTSDARPLSWSAAVTMSSSSSRAGCR